MIELIEALPKKEPTCAAEIRIYSLFKAYGTSGMALFWQQQNDNEETAALISKMDGAVTICVYNNEGTEEIEQFISVIGAQSVLSNLPLNLPDETTLYQFCYAPKNPTRVELATPDYKDAYGVMSTRFAMPPFEAWYPDVCHRVRHGAAELISDGKVALCGFVDGNSMLIVGLCSIPDCKGQGTATKLLKKITNSTLAKNYFVLAEDKLKQYYVNQAFALLGNHYTYGDV